MQRDAFKRALAEAISGLPERERMVIALYYDEELNLREIGQVLGVSESRVCQIHSQATLRLRSRLSDWLSDQVRFKGYMNMWTGIACGGCLG